MTTALWRIAVASVYQPQDLSGAGAQATGGRWNSRGNALVYCSSTIALAALETLVHLGGAAFPLNRYLVRIDVPDGVFAKCLDAMPLVPRTWDALPAATASQRWGDAWLRARSTLLCAVPSVVVPVERNVLINPAHPDAKKLRATVVRKFTYDGRLRPTTKPSPTPRPSPSPF